MSDNPLSATKLSYSKALLLDRKSVTTPDQVSRQLKIAIGGNANMQFMHPGLSLGLKQNRFSPDIHELPYNSWITEALSNPGLADVWVIWISAVGASLGGTVRPTVDTQGILAAVDQLLSAGNRIVVVLPEPLQAEDDPFSPFIRWRQDIVAELESRLPPDVIRYRVDHLQRQIGADHAFSSRYWSTSRAPAHPDLMTAVGAELAAIIAQAIKRTIKALVVDLDNTLWGGIVGDDGPENLLLNPMEEGRPFIEMQRFLLDFSETGVPISVVSKNNPDQAQRPFGERSEMLMSLDDILYFEASWGPKHQAIQKIADALNIGLDTVCLIDDSPHERAEARNFLPDLIVPDLPEEPEGRVAYLRSLGVFHIPTILEDDKHRVDRFKEDKKRVSEAENASSLDEYLKSLSMKLSIATISDATLPRASALVQKTNQFNLCTERRNQSEIASFIDDPDSIAFTVSASDKFGDLGIISVVLAKACDENLVIDTWVLSCRAFSRTIEHGIYAHLVNYAKMRGLDRVTATYEVTDRNQPVRAFFDSIGAEINEDDASFTCWIPVSSMIQHHAEIIEIT